MAAPASLFAGLRKPETMPTRAPKRFYYLVAVWLAVATLLVLGNTYLTDSSLATSWRFPFVTDDGTIALPSWSSQSNHRGKLRVSMVEAAGVHDEVTSALVHAFGGQHDVDLRLYQKRQRYNMSAIVDEFSLSSPIQNITHVDHFWNDSMALPPHVVVSTTCELDLNWRKNAFRAVLRETNAYLFCLVHHADQWTKGANVNVAKEFAAEGRLDMITLSKHTADFLAKNALSTWDDGENVAVHILPPIFPVHAPGSENAAELNLAMQGDFSSARRDYQGIFGGLGSVVEKVNTLPGIDSVTLHLLGHGKHPNVPDNVKSRVVFDENLSYPDFYTILSRAFAVLPSFATKEYYDRKASSTVPASIIAGAPLIANEELLESYSYLPREATWVVREGESELDTALRIIGDQEEFEKKRWLIADTRERLLKENQENVHSWIVNALKKL
ncbi:hypothetical protein LIA77_11728 [Sarocladium implicatum]|nr:hypothetical protein LIA77_11728 [Sarocladium implicatum]